MPISGPAVHQQLMDAYTRIQEDLQRARQQTTTSSTQREELLAKRSDSLLELAEHYLPELSEESIRSTWVEIRPTINEILLQKELQCDRLQAELQQAIAKRLEAELQLVTLNQELGQATEKQSELAREVEKKLRENETFVRLSDRAAMAEAALERAEANLAEIEQDASRKLPAYETSALFQYLRDRHFGTDQYTRKGLTRRMDRWVSKLIDFRKAKQSYDFLRQTPDHMQEIIDQDREAFDVVMTELEAHRDQVAEEAGLPEQSNEVQSLTNKRAKHLEEIDRRIHTCDAQQEKLNETAATRGPHYQEAIRQFRTLLAKVDTRQLDQIARSTPEITDDQIVAKLNGFDVQVQTIDQGIQQYHRTLVSQQQFLKDLGRLIQRFRTAEFDSARSQFVGSLDILEELDRARDAGDVEILWQRIQANQRWGPSTMDKITQVATHPITQVLINAMAHAAGSAMEAHARRAGERRQHGDAWGGSWGRDSKQGGSYRQRW